MDPDGNKDSFLCCLCGSNVYCPKSSLSRKGFIFLMESQTDINCFSDLLPHDIAELCWSGGGFKDLVKW